jgi:aspartate carbamoyltransferase regulatory subunit
MLAVLEPNMTINYIKNGERVEKKQLALPEKIYGIIKCKNPRCITSIEQELPHRFKLTDRIKGVYRCEYCEQKFKRD